jgi:hypothetical protein
LFEQQFIFQVDQHNVGARELNVTLHEADFEVPHIESAWETIDW